MTFDRSGSYTDHNGNYVDPNEVFFYSPDPTIGEIVSRHITPADGSGNPRRSGQVVRLVVVALALLTVGGGLGALFGTVITMVIGSSTPWLLIGGTLLCGVGAASLTGTMRRLPRTCTYVGDEGVARYHQLDAGGRVRGESMRFAEARKVKINEIPVTRRGREVALAFDYVWISHIGSELFVVRGVDYRSRSGAVHPDSPLHFARAARQGFAAYDSKRDAVKARARAAAVVRTTWPFPGLPPSSRQSSEPLPLM